MPGLADTWRIRHKPPSLEIQDDQGKETLESIPLEESPVDCDRPDLGWEKGESCALVQNSGVVLVVHRLSGNKTDRKDMPFFGRQWHFKVSVVHFASRKVLGVVDIGWGQGAELYSFKQGTSILCDLKEDKGASIKVIDLVRMEVVATFSTTKDHRLLAHPDGEHIFIISQEQVKGRAVWPQILTVNKVDKATPLAKIPLESLVIDSAWLEGGKSLLLLTAKLPPRRQHIGPKGTLEYPGFIGVLEIATGTVKFHDGGIVTVNPLEKRTNFHATAGETRLARIPDAEGFWMLGPTEFRKVSAHGQIAESALSITVDGSYEVLSLGDGKAAFLYPRAHTAVLADLVGLREISRIETQTASKRINHAAGHIAKGVLLAMATGVATGGLAYYSLPASTSTGGMAERPDHKYLYVLDTVTHEVTIADVASGQLVTRLSTDGSVSRIQPSTDGKLLLCLAGSTVVQTLNMERNEFVSQ